MTWKIPASPEERAAKHNPAVALKAALYDGGANKHVSFEQFNEGGHWRFTLQGVRFELWPTTHTWIVYGRDGTRLARGTCLRAFEQRLRGAARLVDRKEV